jgi:cytochrome c-type biogenesis protein CcmH
MKILRYLLCISVVMVLSREALAVIETYEFSEPALQLRYQQLSAELRCPKCQNQNIADSNAPIAQDLRKQLHRQLEEGASDEAILEYMVARYGEFVRYRPGFSGATAILWLAPILLLMAACVVLVLTLRAKRETVSRASGALSGDEQERLKTLLDKTEKGS